MEQMETEPSTEETTVSEVGQVDNGKPIEEEKVVKRSSWSLIKCEECTDDIQEYQCRRRKAL
jgi:ribosomal protein L44E